MKKSYLYILLGAVIVGFGVGLLQTLKPHDDIRTIDGPEPYRTSLEGTFVCVPYLDERLNGLTTENCEKGIKTSDTEYYSINFMLMSQMIDEPRVGTRIRANGVVSQNPMLAEHLDIVGVFSVTDSVEELPEDDAPMACTEEAKLCADGSSVGRIGPNCTFAPCPSEGTAAPAQKVTTKLGTRTVIGEVEVTPQRVVSDSRCPVGADCVWPGTVELQVLLAGAVSHGEVVLTLGQPHAFGEYTITLTAVSPIKGMSDIPDNRYNFTIVVE